VSDLQVAVPSHGRAATVNAKTLALLADRGVPADRVRLFVTPEQLADYQAAVDPGLVAEVLPGAYGLAAQRRHIALAYPEGTHLVQLDDDLADVRERLNDKEHAPVPDLAALFAEAFAMCHAAGAGLWGVYPVLNAMFMGTGATTDLRFCIGQLWGVVNRHDPELATELANKEDYERTLRWWHHDGVVVRLNNVAPKSRLYQPGGLQAADQPDRRNLNRREVQWLLQRWPDNVRVAKRRGKMGLEVRLVG
jgi:hypothetical protein